MNIAPPRRRLYPLVLLLTLGCSGSPAPTDSPPADAAAAVPEEAPAAADPVAFDDMDEGQRKTHMKKEVMPAMKAMFAEFDPEHYGSIGCSTCHGASAKKGNFEMPAADLHPLGDIAKEKEEHPEDVEFMMNKVVPEMARLLGEEPFNPETGEGFGCFDCHAKAG